MTTKTHPDIADYMRQLREAMADLPAARRDEIVAEIEEHIQEALAALPSATEADVRNLLERVGDPGAIAAEALERSPDEIQAVRAKTDWPAEVLRFLRRRLRVILVTLLVLVILFAGFSGWYVSRFQPLHADVPGNTSVVRSQAGEPTHINAIDPPTGNPFLAYFVPYRDGEWFEYGFTLTNTSPFAVTVEEIAVPSGDPFRRLQVSISEDSEIPTDPSQVRVRPLDSAFSLPAHTARYILIRGTFGGCPFGETSENAIRMSDQQVRFRFFGVSRTEYLPLPYSIAMSGRTGCPAL